MSPPQQLRQRTSNCSSLLIYRPRKDERLSWPSWLTYSGWFECASCLQQWYVGIKTLLQQNPPVLNWQCRLTQVVLYNGCKMIVCVLLKNATMSLRWPNLCPNYCLPVIQTADMFSVDWLLCLAPHPFSLQSNVAILLSSQNAAFLYLVDKYKANINFTLCLCLVWAALAICSPNVTQIVIIQHVKLYIMQNYQFFTRIWNMHSLIHGTLSAI